MDVFFNTKTFVEFFVKKLRIANFVMIYLYPLTYLQKQAAVVI